MSKEYNFEGKSYIVAREIKQCVDCAFQKNGVRFCEKFLNKTGAPGCGINGIIFKEKPAIKSVPKHWSGQIMPPNYTITAALPPKSERFIVCLLYASYLAPADIPKIHTTRESAEKEAERLCKLYHKEFAVLQVVSAIKPQEPKKEVFA